jgi:type I restriction enzyme S subunit
VIKGWQTKKLGELLEVQNGYAFSSKDYSESGHFVMRIGNVQNGYISLSDPKFIQLPSDGALQRFVLSEGDILVSLTGNVGRIGVVKREHLPAAVNQRVAKITVNKSSPATREFLLFFLYSDRFREELMGAGHGAAQQNVSTKDLVQIQLPIPPLPEQRRIVGILDEAFVGITTAKVTAEKPLQNARALFNSHLNAVFSQRSEGWQTKTIDDVCEVVNGGTPKTGIADYWDGKHQWITPAEMGKRLTPYIGETARSLTDLGLANSSARLLPPFSVILSSRAPIGHLVINTKPMATNQGCKGLVPSKAIEHKYLYYYLTSIVDLLNDLGTGATFKEISGGKLKEVKVPICPLPEQHLIIKQLDTLSAETQRLESIYQQKLEALGELKKSLLNQAFTGDL